MHEESVRAGYKREGKGVKPKENRNSRVRLQVLTLNFSTPMCFPLHIFFSHKPDPQTITMALFL